MGGGTLKKAIGIIGAGSCPPEIEELAREVGREVARRGYVLICGGLGGVMRAACQGAKEMGGLTVGILPTAQKEDANPFVDLAIPTNMGHARNVIIVHSSDALIAIAGGAGTLSEIAIAMKVGKPVVGLKSWSLEGRIPQASRPEEAVQMAIQMMER